MDRNVPGNSKKKNQNSNSMNSISDFTCGKKSRLKKESLNTTTTTVILLQFLNTLLA